jgi:4-amino-4-deoxy-L-arabinose transferase-like glycosyltransferase
MAKEEYINYHQYINYLVYVIITVSIVSWLLYIKLNEAWFYTVGHVIRWILDPEFHITLMSPSIPLAPGFALPLILSSLLVYYLLRKVRVSYTDKIALIVPLSFSFAGWITIILGIFNMLSPFYINISFSFAILCLALLFSYHLIKYKGLSEIQGPLSKILVLMRRCCSSLNIYMILFILLLSVTSFFYFYHAILYPVDEWDALIYHATMSKIIFTYRTFPVIVGPSVGIEMSSNYPPLFPAIAAYFYIQLGTINDIFIRLISPISAVLTIYFTYRLGELLVGRITGLLGSLFIAITPLFVNHAFHTNSYMLQSLFYVSALYFILLYLKHKHQSFLIISGLLTGFALTTGYNAIPLSLVLTSYIVFKLRKDLKGIMKYMVPLMLIGSPWYLRNLLLIGDPVFPYLTSRLQLPLTDLNMLGVTLEGIKIVSYWTAFGKDSPQLLDFLYLLAFHRGLFPSLSLLTLLGVIEGVIVRKQVRDYTLLVLITLIIIPILSGFFVRYFLPVLPLCAILAAFPLTLIVNAYKRRKLLALTLLLLIAIPIVLMPGVPALIGGRSFIPHSPQLLPPGDILFFFKRPGMSWYEALRYEFGEDVDAWMYLNAHLKDYEKVLTMEHRIYYIKNGDPKYFVFLDSDKAKPLYHISDPREMIGWLKERNISYIYLSYPLPPHLVQLPIIKLLGSPYFPVVYWKPNPFHRVYKVGPTTTPITGQDNVYINVDQWMGPIYIENRTAMGIKAGKELAPRIYVATPSFMLVKVVYLDVGKGSLDINLFSPTTSKWYLGLSIVRKEGSGLWREHQFIVPPDPLGFVELGLHAYEDFWVSEIRVEPLNIIRYYYDVGELNEVFSNLTQPPSIMILLPLLTGNETVIVEIKSQYGISIDVFEGIIQPWETTRWWERHRMVARTPELPTLGVQSPTLTWKAEPGLYTLVVALHDEYNPSIKVNISVTIRNSK